MTQPHSPENEYYHASKLAFFFENPATPASPDKAEENRQKGEE